MEEKEKLRLTFSGDDEIELSVLSESLKRTVNCLEKVSDSFIKKNDYCKFVVKIDKGSIIFDISVIAAVQDTIFGTLGAAASIVTVVTGIFAARKFLKGRKPKSIKKTEKGVQIENSENQVINIDKQIFNIYVSDNEIENNLSSLSQLVYKDEKHSSLKIEQLDENDQVKDIVEYTKDDLLNTSIPIDIESADTDIEESISTVELRIKQMSFEGTSKWTFILLFNGQTINATILDEKFLNDIGSSKIGVYAGTKLVCKLRSRTKKDKEGKLTGKTNYSVVQVDNIINPEICYQETIDALLK